MSGSSADSADLTHTVSYVGVAVCLFFVLLTFLTYTAFK